VIAITEGGKVGQLPPTAMMAGVFFFQNKKLLAGRVYIFINLYFLKFRWIQSLLVVPHITRQPSDDQFLPTGENTLKNLRI
jgi:hypothetical protein